MAEQSILDLVVALAPRGERRRAAASLAQRLGASAMFVFVEDQELAGTLVPASGFASTVPGGRTWRELLSRCITPGVHRASVALSAAEPSVPAVALSCPGLAIVLVGTTDESGFETLSALAPLLSALLRAEHLEALSEARSRMAGEMARNAANLTVALDKTRGELERTLFQLQQQAKSLEAASALAEEAARVKDEFLALLGHELRNPLAPIVSALALLKLQGKFSREHAVIERQITQMTRLVDDLLDISRITQGKTELRKERLEVAEVAAHAVEMVAPLLAQKQQTLHLDVPSRGLEVDGDRARLTQVLSNLLTNAAKYSQAQTQINLTARREGGQVFIRVKDQGIGIEPEMLSSVFVPFVQAKQGKDRAMGGLGLGLAIVHSLVTIHGGSVFAQSAGKDRGTEVTVELPSADSHAPPRVDEEYLEAPTATPSRMQRSRVLVVDDNADATELLTLLLTELGFDVRSALTGSEALLLTADFTPEVALLDIGLPDMDGHELATRLRNQLQGRPCLLIALTGYGQESDRQRSLASGFDAHLVKPLDITRLKQILEAT